MRGRRRPVRRYRTGPWAALALPGYLSIGVLLYGVLGYMLLFGWTFLESLYMTIITMTTVGYREVRPLDDGGIVFTISLLLLGVTVLLLTLSIAASVLLEDPIRERLRRRRMHRRITSLEGHHIVCGYGRVGKTVAEELEREGCPFVIIDRADGRERELIEDGVLYLIGDATNRGDLEQAGIHKATALISAVDDDAENIFIAMVARALSPELWIVARASEAPTIDRLHTAGANRVYSPFVTAGKEMAGAAVTRGLVDFFDVEGATGDAMRVAEMVIEADSHLVGRSLGEVRDAAVPLAVRRADGRVLAPPDETTVLGPGDVLVLLGDRADLDRWNEGRARR